MYLSHRRMRPLPMCWRWLYCVLCTVILRSALRPLSFSRSLRVCLCACVCVQQEFTLCLKTTSTQFGNHYDFKCECIAFQRQLIANVISSYGIICNRVTIHCFWTIVCHSFDLFQFASILIRFRIKIAIENLSVSPSSDLSYSLSIPNGKFRFPFGISVDYRWMDAIGFFSIL